jgi:Ser/Thr protein kinase RdoA (MazF antagonist)
MKVESFLNGYRKERNLSEEELKLIPEAGASIFLCFILAFKPNDLIGPIYF